MMKSSVLNVVAVLLMSAGLVRAEPPSSTPAGGSEDDDPVLKILVLPQGKVERRPADEIRVSKIGWVRGISYLVPPRFVPEKPANEMRIAQMRILPSQDDESLEGLLVISGGIGGGVEDNVARWVSQFRDLEGVPTQQDLLVLGTDLVVTEVVVTGTYDAAMPGSPPDLKPDQTLLGAIVQGGPDGLVFIKAVGPKQTMAERRESWNLLIRNLRVQPHPRDFKPRTHGDEPAENKGDNRPPE